MKNFKNLPFFLILLFTWSSGNVFAQEISDSSNTITFNQVISCEDFNQSGIMGDPLQLISGRAPGISFTKKGSDPNVPATISVRGYSADEYVSGIFCIIDGVYGADPRWISPEEIESFEVIKDATALAKYGSQGRPGVILITTKSNKGDKKIGVDFSTNIAWNTPTKKLDVLTAGEYRNLIEQNNIDYFIDGGASTDWQEEIFRNTASQTYTLGVSGKLNKTRYRVSIFHQNNQGIVLESGIKNTGIHLNLSRTALRDRLTLGASLHYAVAKGKILPSYQTESIETNVFVNSLYRNPTFPVYEPGTNNFHQSLWFNPISILEYTDHSITENNAYLNLHAHYQIAKNLALNVNAGTVNSEDKVDVYHPERYWQPAGNRLYYHTLENNVRFNLETKLSYDHSIGLHNFRVTMHFAGWNDHTKDNMDSNYDEYHKIKRKQSVYNIIPRIDYNFRQRLFLSAMLNYERYKNNFELDSRERGSEMIVHFDYTNDTRYESYFPSISAGWRLFEKNKIFDELIIKAGYGIIGNTNAEVMESFLFTLSEMPDMEKTSEFTAGLDFKILKRRAAGALIYYQRNTKNALRFWYGPMMLGPEIQWNTPANDVWVRNSGIEAIINLIPVMTEKLQWKTTFCFHSNKSVFKSTKSGLDNIRTQSYYAQGQGGYPSTQVFKTGTAYPSFYLPKIIGYEDWGSPIYETYYNGDRKYYVMGQPAPKYELGWSNKLDIGSKVALSFSLRYAGGNKLFNATKLQLSNMYNIPRLNVNQDGVKNYALDHQTSELDESYLQNASFLRIENITLSYTIKPRNKNLFQDLVISLGTDNLYTFTGYDGYDPAGYSSGIDSFNVYPLARSYKVGLKINL